MAETLSKHLIAALEALDEDNFDDENPDASETKYERPRLRDEVSSH